MLSRILAIQPTLLLTSLILLTGHSHAVPNGRSAPAPAESPDNIIRSETNAVGVVTHYVAVNRVRYLEPTTTTIRLEFVHELTGDPVTIDYVSMHDHAFVKAYIIDGGPFTGAPTPPPSRPSSAGPPSNAIKDEAKIVWSIDALPKKGGRLR